MVRIEGKSPHLSHRGQDSTWLGKRAGYSTVGIEDKIADGWDREADTIHVGYFCEVHTIHVGYLCEVDTIHVPSICDMYHTCMIHL